MINLLHLFWEFFKIGLFAVGGGMATIPFLMKLTERFSWFTRHELIDMIAISQSTPGPVGINMATFAGFNAHKISGAVIATFSLVLPALVVIMVIAHFLEQFKENKTVQAVFYGIRPAVSAFIAYSVWKIVSITMYTVTDGIYEFHRLNILICILCFLFMQTKKLKKLHPILWISLGAILGMVFQL